MKATHFPEAPTRARLASFLAAVACLAGTTAGQDDPGIDAPPCPDVTTNPGVAHDFVYGLTDPMDPRFEVLGEVLSGQALNMPHSMAGGFPPNQGVINPLHVGDCWIDGDGAGGTDGVLQFVGGRDLTVCPPVSGLAPTNLPPGTTTLFFVDGNWGSKSPVPERSKFAGTNNKNDDFIQSGSPDIWTWNQGGGGPQKNDITNTYFHARDIFNPQPFDVQDPQNPPLLGRDETWIFLSAETRATNGDQHIDFEFNSQGLAILDSNMQPQADFCVDTSGFIVGNGTSGGRTPLDFIVSIDYANGGVNPMATIRQWVDDGMGGGSFEIFDQVVNGSNPLVFMPDGCPDDLNQLGGGAVVRAAANQPGLAIIRPLQLHPSIPLHFDSGGESALTADPLQYIGVGINLTALGLIDPGGGQCNNQSTVMVKTRSSESFTAELKDFVLVNFQLKPVPECDIEGDDQIECGAQDVQYTATETTGQALTPTFNWQIVGIEGKSIDPDGDAVFDDGSKFATGATVTVDPFAVCNGAYKLVVTVDQAGCSSTCEFDVCIGDTMDPMLSGVPADTTVECDAVPNPPAVTATDSCDPDPLVTGPVESTTPGSCPDNYTITRTWTATDDCLNTATASQNITVVDTTDPMLMNVPADTTAECDDIPASGTPTASDNCDPNPMVTGPVQSTTPGSCPDSYTLTRTWTATDRCGNSATASQDIVVSDTTDPMLMGIPADTTAECDAIPDPPAVTASDNCDPNPMVTGPVETTSPGTCPTFTITRTWTATDRCGNTATASQDIVVSDSTPPMLENVPADTSAECDAIPTSPNPTASDNCDPNPMVTGPVETTTPGTCPDSYTLTRTWTATDACLNSATASQDITVVDTTDPMLMNVPADTTAECDNVPTSPDPTASDNCDPNPVVSGPVQTTTPGTCPDNYTLTRTWTATDRCGNSATASQDIVVRDMTAPVLSGCPEGCTFIDCRVPVCFTVSATDNCDESPDIRCELTVGNPNQVILMEDPEIPGKFSIELLVDLGCGEVVVTCYATDDCGNESSCSFMFECVDMACRMTGGGNIRTRTWTTYEGTQVSDNHISFGGQAGAPTAMQPTPCGQWTHRQHSGSEGKWTFHAGTASAPEGTYIDEIICRDEGTCFPSGNPPSPAREVSFRGVGTFRNFHGGGDGRISNFEGFIVPHSNKTSATRHWFEVDTEDNGEPGNKYDFGAICPDVPEGTADTGGVSTEQDCGCPDFYRIRIYRDADDPLLVPSNPLIYEVFGYHQGGNFQTHAPVFGSTCGSGLPAGGDEDLGGLSIPDLLNGGTIDPGETGGEEGSRFGEAYIDGQSGGGGSADSAKTGGAKLQGADTDTGVTFDEDYRRGCDCPLCRYLGPVVR